MLLALVAWGESTGLTVPAVSPGLRSRSHFRDAGALIWLSFPLSFPCRSTPAVAEAGLFQRSKLNHGDINGRDSIGLGPPPRVREQGEA